MTRFVATLVAIFVSALCAAAAGKTANAVERERNIYVYVIFPRVFDPIATIGLETPIQIRAFMYLNVAQYNSWVNYHPTAVDIFGRAPNRRPPSEHTIDNKNIAALYALYRVYSASPHSFGGPAGLPEFRNIFKERGLDPADARTKGSDPIAVGNRAGFETARVVLTDGWNPEGRETADVKAYQHPFQDPSGYVPLNRPGKRPPFPLRWAPLLESNDKGSFSYAAHAVPQAAHALTFSLSREFVQKRRLRSPYKTRSAPFNRVSKADFYALKRGAESVFNVSRQLTERQRVLAELFDNKLIAFRNEQNPGGVFSVSAVLRFAMLNTALDWSYDEELLYGVAANILSYDATVLVWKEKRRIDAVRPTGDLMRYVFGEERKTVWGGPGLHPKSIAAGSWRSYIGTMAHSEFPSASSCLCSALVEHALIYTGGKNEFPYNVTVPKGSSAFYPGQIPETDVTIPINKLSDWASLCGVSRLYAGVHFPPAVPAGEKLCHGVAAKSQQMVDQMVAGTYKPVWQNDVK